MEHFPSKKLWHRACLFRLILKHCGPVEDMVFAALRSEKEIKKCNVECGTQIAGDPRRHKVKCRKGQIYTRNEKNNYGHEKDWGKTKS